MIAANHGPLDQEAIVRLFETVIGESRIAERCALVEQLEQVVIDTIDFVPVVLDVPVFHIARIANRPGRRRMLETRPPGGAS